MLELIIRNAEGNLAETDREYAAKRFAKLDRYFNQAQKAELVHRQEKTGHVIEVTVFADGMTFRGQEVDSEVHAAIDKVGEKLENRLRRAKRKLIGRLHKRGDKLGENLAALAAEPDEEPEPKFTIKERKHFLLKPMLAEEAALEMEMIDHSFFVFKNEETNAVEVLFKRKDGSYGLLQPEV